MSYIICDKTNKKEYKIDLPNCTISGNSVEYRVKDDKIKKYSIIDGKIDERTGTEVDKVELTNYQVSFFNWLRNNDGNSEKLDKNDFINLTPELIQAEMNRLYNQGGCYSVKEALVRDESIELKLTDAKKEYKISFQEEKISIWDRIKNFFKSIGNWFMSLFSKEKSENKKGFSSEKADKVDLNSLFNKDVNIEESFVHEVKSGDTAINIAINNGISLYRLKKENPKVDLDAINIGDKLNIPQRACVKADTIKNISDIAKVTGVSEDYIKNILFGIEGLRSKPLLKAEYDNVPEKNHPKGYLTIGFGHTGRVKGNIIKENTQITENEAYQLLAQDILDAKLDAISYFGSDFLEAPKSIQDGIIDLIFNKGIKNGLEKSPSPTNNLRNDLENKDYISAAKDLIYETDQKGLKKRNVYRVFTAVKDLSVQEKRLVLNSFEFTKYFASLKLSYISTPKEILLMNKAYRKALEE